MSPTRRHFLKSCAAVATGAVAAPPALAQTSGLPGIDVSHWQQTINWSSVAASGKIFAICKATEGLTYVDPMFSTNWPAIKAVGMFRGAYHFGRPGSDPVAQARHFHRTVQPVTGDLPLVLDLEEIDGRTPTQVKNWTQRFAAEIRRRTGRPALIYTGYYTWRDDAGNSINNFDMALWMARWSTTPFPLPVAWSGWTFWQYSSTGSVSGISVNCDLDYFNGSQTTLQNYTLP